MQSPPRTTFRSQAADDTGLPPVAANSDARRFYPAVVMAVTVVCLSLYVESLAAQETPAKANGTRTAAPSKPRAVRVKDLEFAGDSIRYPASMLRVMSLAFSPDGKLIATGNGWWRGETGAIQVWNVETGERVAREALPIGSSQVAWTADGQHVVASIWNSTVRSSAFPGLKREAVIAVDRSSTKFGISPDGTRIVTATEGYHDLDDSPGRTVQIWDAKTGKLIRQCSHESNLFRLGWAAWSPKGKYVAAAGGKHQPPQIGEARVWDPVTGKQVSRFAEHTQYIRAIEFFPDDLRVATAALDGTVRIWEAETGKSISQITTSRPLIGMDISPDGSQIATVSYSGTVSLWDVQTQERVAEFNTRGQRCEAVAFAPDGQRLAAGGIDGIVKAWDVPTRSLQQELPAAGTADRPGELVLIAPATGSQMVAVVYDTGELRLIEPATESVLWKVAAVPGQAPTAVAISPDRARVLVGTADGQLRMHSAKDGKVQHELKQMPGQVMSVCFSASGDRFATGDNSGRVWFWDGVRKVPLAEHREHPAAVLAIGYSAQNGSATSVAVDGSTVTWRAENGQKINAIRIGEGALKEAAISRDGSTLFVTGALEPLWDAVTLEPLPGGPALRNGTGSVALSADGSHLIAVDTNTTLLFDLRKPEEIRGWETPSGNARSPIAFSPEDRFLYQSNGAGGLTIRVSVPGPKAFIGRIPRFGNATAVTVSPDGKWLAASGDDSQVTLWNLATGEVVDVLSVGGGTAYVCRFSADSKLVAAGTLGGTISVWKVADRSLVGTLEGAHTGVRSLAFSPDSRWLVSGGMDRVLKVTDLTTMKTAGTYPDQPLWVEGLTFSADGRMLYSVTGSWDAKDQPAPAHLSAWTVTADKSSLALQLQKRSRINDATVDNVVITNDSKLLVTACSDGQINVWDAQTLAPVRAIRHPISIHRVHLIPNQQSLLVIGDHRGGVSVWDITTGLVVARYAGHEGHVFDVTSLIDGSALITAGEDKTLKIWPGPLNEPSPAFQKFLNEAAPLELP